MTRDQIVQWAKDSTAPEWWDEPFTGWHMGLDLHKFAKLVAAAEREACAIEADAEVLVDGIAPRIAEAIRARGKATKEQP